MRPFLLLRTLPALLASGAVSFAHAQAPNPAPAPVVVGRPGQPLGQPPSQPQEDRGPQLDFTFHNLPLVEVIHQIQTEYHKASGKHLNIMIPENLRDVAATNRIDVELKQITVPEVLELLGMASQRPAKDPYPNPVVRPVGGFQSGYSTVGYVFRRVSSNEGTLTYLLNGQYPPVEPEAPQPPQPVPPEPTPPRAVFFFSLDPYLDRFSVEDIITAVKTGWDLDGKKDRPTLKYHEETKLLVASGDPGQVEMIKTVLSNLRAGSQSNRRDVPTAQPPQVPVPYGVQGLPVPPAPAKP